MPANEPPQPIYEAKVCKLSTEFSIDKKVLSEATIQNAKTQRTFGGWASVEVVDKEGDVVEIDGLLDACKKFFARTPVIQDLHSSAHLGLWTFYEKRTHPQSGKPGLWVEGFIYEGEDFFNKIWDCFKEGKVSGLSIGFAIISQRTEYDSESKSDVRYITSETLLEISVVHSVKYWWGEYDYEPANQHAEVLEYNTTAKVNPMPKKVEEAEEQVVKADDSGEDEEEEEDEKCSDSSKKTAPSPATPASLDLQALAKLVSSAVSDAVAKATEPLAGELTALKEKVNKTLEVPEEKEVKKVKKIEEESPEEFEHKAASLSAGAKEPQNSGNPLLDSILLMANGMKSFTFVQSMSGTEQVGQKFFQQNPQMLPREALLKFYTGAK